MISFFRNIRRGLLRDNNVSRYLMYALGEIILVMVGILLALYINTLNEESKNRKREKLYIENLVADLKQDAALLELVIDFNSRKALGLDSLVQFNYRDLTIPANNDSLHLLFAKYASNYRSFERNNRTIRQLESTGDYILIRKVVSDSLTAFVQTALSMEAQGKAYEKSFFNTIEIGFKLIDFNSLMEYIEKGGLNGNHFPASNADPQLKREFFNNVALFQAITSNYVSGMLRNQQSRTEQFIAYLEETYDLAEK